MPRIPRVVTSLLVLLEVPAFWLSAGVAARAGATERWVVCYNDTPSSFDLTAYDVVVLDPDQHPPLGPITDRGRTVLAYLSLTELGRERSVFPALQAAGVVLDAHPVWTDAHYLDFRRDEWTQTVIEELVPQALAAGFTGLFLDTLDDAAFLEARDPVKYRGMRQAAVELVRGIRHHYPQIVLMVNRGYDIVPEIAGSIDILLGESVLTSFDPVTKAYRRVPPAEVQWQIDALNRARSQNPDLKIFTLDYWDPADTDGMRRLYRDQRANGFVPYVSTPLLDRVVEEPR
jgi:uncharacterized protein (TIGR01370 family)